MVVVFHNHIVVSFLCIMLDGESTGIATRVGKFAPKGDGGETNKDQCTFPSLRIETSLVPYQYRTRLTVELKSTFVRWDVSYVASKYPKAPEPAG
jgi:hypothetical protein